VLNRELPLWYAEGWADRLRWQSRLQLVQVVAWDGTTPLGRGMLLFAEDEDYSESAARERCAEVRDLSVAEPFRRRGVATAIMAFLEQEARIAGYARIGLSVSLDEAHAPARSLYERLGYVHAHGPFLISTTLDGDDGPFPVGDVVTYLVRDL
jgi:GNAT superfamily N-acetyltransferase